MSILSADRTKRIAMPATPFGFGPASKAYTIGRLPAQEYGMDVHYYGSGSARDSFDAQEDVSARHISPEALERDPSFLCSCNAIVNVLAPELLLSREVAEATYYVDSLGFMWQEADLPQGSLLKHVRCRDSREFLLLGPSSSDLRHW